MSYTIQKAFLPGDKWLYYKIYTGPKTSDKILVERIKPIADWLLANKYIDKWFFIRYADPNFHLRLRFSILNVEHMGLILNKIQLSLKELQESNLIWNVQLDTYHREIDRYGVSSMELSEDLFFFDSIMIVDFLALLDSDESEDLRWLFGMKAMDDLLNSFNYEDFQKLALMHDLKLRFGNEFGMNRMLKKQLDDKFRVYRNEITKFLISTESMPVSNISIIIDILNKRKLGTESIILEILNREPLNPDLNSLINSYIHMLLNRLFKSKNRLHELVCYDFMYRFYKSKLARKKS